MPEPGQPDPATVQLLVLDVDGVLTDGSILIDDAGRETKRFFVRDGVAIRSWRRLGFEVALLTGRGGDALTHRVAELGVEHVVQNAHDKGAAVAELAGELGFDLSLTAFVGDDWPDLPAMRAVGYPIAVADAEPIVRSAAVFVTTRPGGRGAVREVVEHLLQSRDLLGRAVGHYDSP